MLRAGAVMALTHCLLLLFLLALQAQKAHSTPIHGPRAVVAREDPPPSPQRDSMLIPSWYLQQTDPDTVLETLPIGESDSLPISDEETEKIEGNSTPDHPEEHSRSGAGQKAKSAGNWDTRKNYIVGTVAAAVLLLLVVAAGYIVMYQLLKRDTTTQGDKEAAGQVYTASSQESKDHPRGICEAESGEGPGWSEKSQAQRFRDSCCLFPEVFAAELTQLYKNMGADSSPLPTCPFCALADGTSSRDHWISLDSPQPTPSWCPCYQYQQEYFILEDNGYFSDSM